ncbi:MAG: hypothetical protein SGJ09_02165 [Phycisphaerae bacterium]|nr:hypothetical protein [Phycisphaerae bacterium]
MRTRLVITGMVLLIGAMLLTVLLQCMTVRQHEFEVNLCGDAMQLEKARSIGARDGEPNLTVNDLVSGNYFSPVLAAHRPRSA